MLHGLHGTSAPMTDEATPRRHVAESAASGGDRRRWWVLALLGAAQFMLIIDVTVVNVALPSIGRDLMLDRSQLTWIVTAYTLLFGSLMLLGGRLADTFGRRRVFLTGLAVFVAASLGSGLAPDGTVLVTMRALQGVGASLLSPSALSMVTTIFNGPERNRALSVWAALGGAGAAVGVILGGVLTSGPGWQWIFLVNVPVGLVVGAGVTRWVRATPPRAGRSLDLPGALLLVPAVGLAFWGIIGAGDSGWTSLATLLRFGGAIVLTAMFVRHELSVPEPLIRLGLLAERSVATSVALLIGASMILAGMIFLNSLYLQATLGLSALETGLLFVPMALAVIAGSQVGVGLIAHAGSRAVAVAGLVLAAVGMAYLTRLPTTGDVLLDVLPGLVVVAFGLGAILLSAQTSAFAGAREADAGILSGLVNTSHEMGLALGVAVLSTIGGASLTAGPAAGGAGFGGAFAVAAGIAVVTGAAMLHVMPSGRPASTGRRLFAH